MKILVAGAGGFIGGFLVKSLLADGHTVFAADIKPISSWWQVSDCNNFQLNLEDSTACDQVSAVDHIYNLACNMGGIGFIENNKSTCMFSALINTNLLRSAIKNGVKRYFFASTACIYNIDKQSSTNTFVALKETDAHPAKPERGYGWEKLFAEQLCLEVANEGLIETRIARFHNVYGSHGAWSGGREKAPAALCRKIAESKIKNKREIGESDVQHGENKREIKEPQENTREITEHEETNRESEEKNSQGNGQGTAEFLSKINSTSKNLGHNH